MTKTIFKAVSMFIGTAFFLPLLVVAQTTSEVRDFNSANVTGDTMYFWVGINSTHQIDFGQYNISSTSVTYKITRTDVSMVAGASAWFCVYHNADPLDTQSQCYPPAITTSGNFVTAPGDFNLLLADFATGPNTGTSVVTYTFFNANTAGDTAKITLIYIVTPVGIAENSVASGRINMVYPNPSSGVANVSYSSDAVTTEVVVSDVTGKEIERTIVADQAGMVSLNTSEWASGLYVISLVSDGITVAREKLVVE